jgi:DNA-binding MarR family transcriptional regulator
LSKTEKDLGLKILMDLRKITRAIDLNSKKLSSETSLTAPQVVSLIAVYHHEALTLAEIAEQVHLSSSTMVGIIDRLEAKNLVIRERSKTDRRQVLIRITEEGRKMAKKSPLPLQEELIRSLSKLPEAQQRNLAKALELLVKMLDFKDD